MAPSLPGILDTQADPAARASLALVGIADPRSAWFGRMQELRAAMLTRIGARQRDAYLPREDFWRLGRAAQPHLLAQPIQVLGMSLRVNRTLWLDGHLTVGALLALSAAKLQVIPGLGAVGRGEIRDALARLGMQSGSRLRPRRGRGLPPQVTATRLRDLPALHPQVVEFFERRGAHCVAAVMRCTRADFSMWVPAGTARKSADDADWKWREEAGAVCRLFHDLARRPA